MVASIESRVALKCFVIGISLLALPLLLRMNFVLEHFWQEWTITIIIFYLIAMNIYLYFSYKFEHDRYQIAVRAGCLGLVTAVGLLVSFSETSWIHFGWYLTALAFFHWSEYYVTAMTNPSSLTLASFLLDHSLSYQLAAVASWLEFAIEWYFFPHLKLLHYVSLVGLVLVVGGEVLRKCSMFTAKTNFNHYIQHIRRPGHTLVTSGVYSFSRHPSYVGWFYWSIGTQIVLCNPICFIVYSIVSWQFFNERIYEEEITLLNFFGEDYMDYQRKVGTGLPFIKGYISDTEYRS